VAAGSIKSSEYNCTVHRKSKTNKNSWGGGEQNKQEENSSQQITRQNKEIPKIYEEKPLQHTWELTNLQ